MLRQFRLSPVFTATAVLTLALGIGGHHGDIHPYPRRDAALSTGGRACELYRIGEGDDCCVEGGTQDTGDWFSYPLYERLKQETPEFEQVTAFQAGQRQVSVRREGAQTAAQPLRSEYVTGNYFSTLGIGAYGGRVISPQDDTPGSAPVVVLSYHSWQTTYGADASIVNSTFMIEGHPFTVVGIAPPGFFGETLRSDPPDVWIPVQRRPLINADRTLLHQSVSAWLRVIGRVRPGASTAGMSARLTTVLRQWILHDSGYPANWMPDIERDLYKQVLNVVPAGAGVAVMKEEYGRSLNILLGVCGLVLLIACANVANLLLARGVARRGQTAIRMAIGASRRQIVLQALMESVMLSVGGAMAGLVVAFGASKLLLVLAFQDAEFLRSIQRLRWSCWHSPSRLHLLPASSLAQPQPGSLRVRIQPMLCAAQAVAASDRSSFARKALLVLQATLSVVLVAGATCWRAA